MATLMSSLFLLIITFFSFHGTCQAKIAYADHCHISQATFSRLSLDTTSYVSLHNTHFSGGDKLFGPDSNPSSSSSSSSSLTYSKQIYFYSNKVYRTETPHLFLLSAELNIQTGSSSVRWMPSSRRYRMISSFRGGPRGKYASFHMSGFWDKSTGKLCLVGTGSTTSDEGTRHKLAAVFNLNFPNKTDIHTSIISGKVEILGNDTLSVLGYTENNYNYTQIERVKNICPPMKESIELLGFGNQEDSRFRFRFRRLLSRFLRGRFKLEYGKSCSTSNCNPLSHKKGSEFSPSFINLNHIYVNEDGKVHMLIGFSNGSDAGYGLIPDKFLVAEGYWDSDKKTLCLLACPIIETVDHSVGECTIGLSFWFPAIVTIKDRSNVVGRIWSTVGKSHPSYFNPISFRSLGGNVRVLPGAKYKYTETDSMKRACGNTRANNLTNERYPDADSIEDLTFDLTLNNGSKKTLQGYATPLSLGDNFYGDSISVNASEISFLEKYHSTNNTIYNVSYVISYSLSVSSFEVEEVTDISAEGIYDSGSGKLCMVGCRSTRGESADSADCEIHIDMQLSPLNQVSSWGLTNSTRHLNGTIRSLRKASDSLYFAPLELSSYTMYETEAREVMSRMDMEIIMEIIMVTVSLTLSCVFILFQLIHVKKNKDVLSSISITMLVILTLGYMIPLVLNFEASFLKYNRTNYMLWAGGWLQANEVIVRIMTMVSFLLQIRLLQLAWASKFSEENKKRAWVPEWITLRFCLPLYFTGALIAWFVHTRSNKTQLVNVDYLSTQRTWEDLTSYIGLILDGFLLPQIFLNVVSNLKAKALSPVFYVGATVIRVMPHLYNAYRARYHVPYSNSSYIYANPAGDYYSSVWDIVVPLGCLLFMVLIFLQQRFSGRCFLPQRFRKPGGYEAVPVIGV